MIPSVCNRPSTAEIARHHPHIEMAEGQPQSEAFVMLCHLLETFCAETFHSVKLYLQHPDEVHGIFEQLFLEQCGKKYLVRHTPVRRLAMPVCSITRHVTSLLSS